MMIYILFNMCFSLPNDRHVFLHVVAVAKYGKSILLDRDEATRTVQHLNIVFTTIEYHVFRNTVEH